MKLMENEASQAMGGLFDRIGLSMGILILLLVALVVILTVITVSMSIRLSRLTKKYYLFMKGKDGQSMERVFTQKFSQMDRLLKQTDQHNHQLTMLQKYHETSLNKYGIVKYDAFDDVGGKLSFAMAMLDSENSGFVLDAIHSRDNCFLYLKEIVKGESYIMLSEEELAALKAAVNSVNE